MPRSIAALVLFVALLFAGLAREAACEESPPATSGACVVCSGTLKSPCPTCAGKGSFATTCALCAGTGRVACSAGDTPHAGTDLDCPNSLCTKGTITWTDGKKSTCKLCSGAGKIRCAGCQIAASPCGGCSGRRKVDTACFDCAGRGKFACSLCAARSPRCGQCDGQEKLPCPGCRASGSESHACAGCAARGIVFCGACLGLGKLACAACEATGRYRAEFEDGTSAASQHCGTCGGRGTRECALCTAGRAICPGCDGKKLEPSPCALCGASRKVDCPSCGASFPRAAELLATRLATSSAQPRETQAAIQLLTMAIDRASELARAAAAEAAKIRESIDGLPTAQRRDAARTQQFAEDRERSFKELIARCKPVLDRLRPPPPTVK